MAYRCDCGVIHPDPVGIQWLWDTRLGFAHEALRWVISVLIVAGAGAVLGWW